MRLNEFGFPIDRSGSGGGGGTSTLFYKCSEVVPGETSWSGKLASVDQDTGVWSFAEQDTPGLTYDRFVPVVGKVYDEGCTMQITQYKTNSDGLVFHHSLRSATPFDDLGTSAMTYNNVTFAEIGGRYCMYRDGTAWAEGTPNNQYLFPYGQQPFTMCIWAWQVYARASHRGFCGYGTSQSAACGIHAYLQDYDIFTAGQYGGGSDIYTAKQNGMLQETWQHLAYSYDGISTYVAYLDGEVVNTFVRSYANPVPSGCNMLIGKNPSGHMNSANYLSDCRLYNRVLSQSEIQEIMGI